MGTFLFCLALARQNRNVPIMSSQDGLRQVRMTNAELSSATPHLNLETDTTKVLPGTGRESFVATENNHVYIYLPTGRPYERKD